MANKERGEIDVKVGGKVYILRPTFDAICEYERITGKSPEEFFQDFERGTFSGVRASVWCVLQHAHADEIRELKDASAWIEQAGGLDVVITYLKRLQALNAEPPKGATTVNPPRAQAGHGRRSSRTRG